MQIPWLYFLQNECNEIFLTGEIIFFAEMQTFPFSMSILARIMKLSASLGKHAFHIPKVFTGVSHITSCLT